MNKNKRVNIFEIFKKNNPNPTTELEFNSNFELLIAVVLSAQATDVSVNKVTRRLFKIANTPESMLKLGEEKIKQHIKTIGLYKTKSRNIILLCQKLTQDYHGNVPQTRTELESLAGVGRKTANVILNTAYSKPVIAVDTHIFRLANRLKLAPGKTVLEVENKLTKLIPKPYLINAHHWLILHGRYTCTARKPLCGICAIYQYCEYTKKQGYL